jgi:diamine N-acetyltransferase
LIAHVAERAKKQGYPCVILQVNKRNDKAINSYMKYGFAVRNTTVDDIGHGYVMDDFVMEKKL